MVYWYLVQCEKLRSEIESSGLDVDVTFVSPLFRTLQVILISLLSFIISDPWIPDCDVEPRHLPSKDSDDCPGQVRIARCSVGSGCMTAEYRKNG